MPLFISLCLYLNSEAVGIHAACNYHFATLCSPSPFFLALIIHQSCIIQDRPVLKNEMLFPLLNQFRICPVFLCTPYSNAYTTFSHALNDMRNNKTKSLTGHSGEGLNSNDRQVACHSTSSLHCLRKL